MSKPLTIVAISRARPGCEDDLHAALRSLVEPSRRDPGCLQYDLHVSVETPGEFLFYENWATRAEWQAHMETPHLTAWIARAPELVADSRLLQMEPDA